MSFFKEKQQVRCGAIIDIGSGSVGVAIVVSNDIAKTLDIVWSHREYMLIREYADTDQTLKEIHTTLITAFLELGNTGIKALHAFDPELTITEIQSTQIAPWSHTISQKISYTDEKPFIINTQLLSQLAEKAKVQTLETQIEGKTVQELGLRLITDKTIDIEINGYSIKKSIGKKTNMVLLTHIHALALESILYVIEDSQEKILPHANVVHFSFMYLFYEVLKNLHPNTTDVCLVDVTDEAIEIALVHDNILSFSTHATVGLYSITREIAEMCKIPKEEAYNLLKDETTITNYTEEQQIAFAKIMEAFEIVVSELFTQTGGMLTIPNALFIHTSKNTEAFFAQHLKQTIKRMAQNEHTIHLVTSEVLQNATVVDTAILLSAHYFHTKLQYKAFVNEE
jgi:hypothetical protein